MPGALRLADHDEKRARDELTHSAWGQKLSVAEFVAREERLRAHPWAKSGMRTWLYLDGDRVLASCESFEMLSFLDGKAGRTFGVASVYTEPALRGRGHAARMMELLVEAVGPHQAGILFSDVGDYYARVGWRAVPAVERALLPSPSMSEPAGVERLSAAEVDEAWPRVDVPRARFIVWPTPEQLDWQRDRERVYASFFGRAPLSHAGARTADGLVAWAADFKKDKLLILHLSGGDPRPLVAAAQHQAAAAGLSQVVAWDVLAGWPDGLGASRPLDDSLPMVLPLAPGAETWSYVPRALWIRYSLRNWGRRA